MYRYWASMEQTQEHRDENHVHLSNCARVSPTLTGVAARSKNRNAHVRVSNPGLKKRSGLRHIPQHQVPPSHQVTMSEAHLPDMCSPVACRPAQIRAKQRSAFHSTFTRPPWGDRQSLPAYLIPSSQAERQQKGPKYPFSAFQAGSDLSSIFPSVFSSFPAQLSRMTFDTSSDSSDSAYPPTEGLGHPQPLLMHRPLHVHAPHMFHSPVPNSFSVVFVPPPTPRRLQTQPPFDKACSASSYLVHSPDPHSTDTALAPSSTPRHSQIQSPCSKACTAYTACTAGMASPKTPRAIQSTQELLDRLTHAFSTSEHRSDHDDHWAPPAPPQRPLPQSLFSSECNAFSSDCQDVGHMGRPVQSGNELLHKLHRLCDTANSRQFCA